MPDLSTRYLGMALSGPLVASASPLTGQLDTLRRLEDAGASAVVLPSLFEEDVIEEEMHLFDVFGEGEEFAEFASAPLPQIDMPELGSRRHLNLVERAKRTLSIPVIASLNATRPGSWQRYATQLVDAGADAIELNQYTVAADPRLSASDLETRQLDIIAAVRASVDVPLAVKLSPFYSSLSHFARRAVDAGADALVLFNRFYAPDIDIDNLDVVPSLTLSTPVDLRLPLRWLGILRSQMPDAGFACSSGVHSGLDVAKAVLAGADVACTTSAVLHAGPEIIRDWLDELGAWLAERGYESVDQARGSMVASAIDDPSTFERSQYRAIITSARGRR